MTARKRQKRDPDDWELRVKYDMFGNVSSTEKDGAVPKELAKSFEKDKPKGWGAGWGRF